MTSPAEFKAKMSERGYVKWLAEPEIETLWSFDLKVSPTEIWPFLTDTSRLNREMGFGAREQNEVDGKLRVTTVMLGQKQIWIEEPWNWIENEFVLCSRVYERGFAKRMLSVFEVEELADGGSRVRVYFSWIARGWFWRTVLRLSAGALRSKFAAAFKKVEEELTLARTQSKALPVLSLREVDPQVRATLKQRLDPLDLDSSEREVAERLLTYVLTAESFDVEPIRALKLARAWDVHAGTVTSLCLQFTRLGMLKISWDVICPHCRGSKYSAETMGSIPAAANCSVCEIEFTTSEENSIEVLFHVHPSIRKVETAQYCAAEPAKKIHIRAQLSVEPRQKVALSLSLPSGRYVARALGVAASTEFEVPKIEGTELENPRPKFTYAYENSDSKTVQVVIEDAGWSDDHLRPGYILAQPAFRDVFAKEHLDSQVKLFLGTQTILFTDIVGSTNFYSRSGDAKAFAEVQTHFQTLFQIVKKFEGVVVKTMGDAVMASFLSPAKALEAAVEMQMIFHGSRVDTSIRLRVAIHSGPVIAVDLSNGLDYFGNTVNFAAKIQACAGAGEIALSGSVFESCSSDIEYPSVMKSYSHDGAQPIPVHVLQILSCVLESA